MLFLALDTTTSVCSASLGDKDKLLAEGMLNIKKTHSQRLMPLIISLFAQSGIGKESLSGIAVTIGPGGFTGVRIGLATAKGLSQGLGIPVIGVMTLDALAEAGSFYPGFICPVLDARKGQVYTALYEGGRGKLQRVEHAAALTPAELSERLKDYRGEILFLGDALDNEGLKEEIISLVGNRYVEAPPELRWIRSSLVLKKGIKQWEEEGPMPLYSLKPLYLRLSEAERNLQEKKKGEGQ